MNKVVDYAIALTHLYGLVHKDKVVEIYNKQNEEEIDENIINDISKQYPEDLSKNFVEVHGEYFVAESIMEFDDFQEQLRHRKGKPFYIPEKEELLKYKEETYFEINKEYKALLNYVTKNIFDGDDFKAEMLCEDIQGICQFGFSIQNIFDVFNVRNISFKSENEVSEMMQLVMDLANNTRLWENNGHTPSEMFEKSEQSNLRSLSKEPFNLSKPECNIKIGRNDPCPCGSGNKYKKCCLH